MKVHKKIRNKVSLHSREVFKLLGIPNYDKVVVVTAECDRKRTSGEGIYFYLNITWDEHVTEVK